MYKIFNRIFPVAVLGTTAWLAQRQGFNTAAGFSVAVLIVLVVVMAIVEIALRLEDAK